MITKCCYSNGFNVDFDLHKKEKMVENKAELAVKESNEIEKLYQLPQIEKRNSDSFYRNKNNMVNNILPNKNILGYYRDTKLDFKKEIKINTILISEFKKQNFSFKPNIKISDHAYLAFNFFLILISISMTIFSLISLFFNIQLATTLFFIAMSILLFVLLIDLIIYLMDFEFKNDFPLF